ncbi:MAG: zinc-finger domain-containing protein [Albidovulum sp.]|nr:zinc-finger domain-containing protein [Albidovulum sp.]MDE0533796.1 zinc-finger domain-containing protein [Albidovulum sp.]
MTHNEPETVIVENERVSCDGGGALGHPRVWYLIPRETGRVECGYCDRVFILKGCESKENQ